MPSKLYNGACIHLLDGRWYRKLSELEVSIVSVDFLLCLTYEACIFSL